MRPFKLLVQKGKVSATSITEEKTKTKTIGTQL
jgi:hypothetical protein